MKPIIKYAGSKRWLAQYIPESFKEAIKNGAMYIEPFCGSAALALALQPKKCILNDFNWEIYNLYCVISHYPEALIEELKFMQQMYENKGSEYFYQVRAWDREESFKDLSVVLRAARYIFLNKTCFNGLSRYNSKGQFNSPIGRTTTGKLPEIVQEDLILELSTFLENCDIHNKDFLEITSIAKSGDCIFMDPPYIQCWDNYTKEGFGIEKTISLRDECNRLRNIGCKLIITNDNNETIKDLFSDWTIKEIAVKRSINCKADGRKGSEVIITNVD